LSSQHKLKIESNPKSNQVDLDLDQVKSV